MSSLGIVIIGRNEGARLVRCLRSVAGEGRMVVYVDSGSTDRSVAAAREMGVEVVELDTSVPFTAARGRNAGFERLLELRPDLPYVQFVDGDCEIIEGWLERAARELADRPEVVAVCGRLRERHPEASIYNRLCDMEWNGPVGEIEHCGGIAMYRVATLAAAGGFNPGVAAGEEPELCLRLRRAGGKVVRLAGEMGWHDAAMLRFGQWWRRQVRSGYGTLDVQTRFGVDRYRQQVHSARVWTVGVVALAAVAGIAGAMVGGWVWATAASLLALAAWPAQILRLGLRNRSAHGARAFAFAAMTLVSKWGQLAGHLHYWRDRLRGRQPKLIEYKNPSLPAQMPPVERAAS